MDRNSILAFTLIFAIVTGYFWYTQPSAEEKARQQHVTDSLRRADSTSKIAAAAAQTAKKDSTPLASQAAADSVKLAQAGGFASAFSGEEKLITLKNKDLRVTLSSHGAKIRQVELPGFKNNSNGPVKLIGDSAGTSGFNLNFLTTKTSVNSEELYWTLISGNDTSAVFRLPYDSSSFLEQRYSLSPEGYLLSHNIRLRNMQQVISPNRSDIELIWHNAPPKQEKEITRERETSTIYYKYTGESPDYINERNFSKEDLKGKVDWISFKQQYFNASLISLDGGFEKDGSIETTEQKSGNYVKNMKASVYLPFNQEDNQDFRMQWYFGPNHFSTLKKLDIDLHRIIPLGWGIIGWVNRFIVIPVFNFLDDFIGSYGIIILILTIIIKIVLLPLVYRSYISTAKMRILKPELDAIKEKHEGDMQKIQSENLALYRKAGVNPLSGCLPILLQMPILIAMFQFFPASFELRQESFLWAQDLSRYDSIWNFPNGFNIPFYGNHISLFTLLMTISTLIYTRMNNQLTGVSGQMKWISYVMPILFLGFFNNYAAGLTYYYFIANMVTFGQQAIIRRFVDDKKLHAQIAENRKKPVKKSAFQTRLEEYAKKRGIDPKQMQKPPRKK